MSAQFPDEADYGGEAESPGLPAFLLDPQGVVSRRWRWMVASLLLGLTATGAAVYSVVPRFAAEASVLITSQEIPEEFVRSTVRESSMANLDATVNQVLSNQNLQRIIDQFDLYEELRATTSLDTLAARVRSDIAITPERSVTSGSRKPGSIVYRLGFESNSAQGAANVANALAALVVEASILQRNEQAQRITRFLKSALLDDERELREQAKKVSEFRRAHRGELPEELDTNMRKLELLHERRAAQVAQIAQSEGRILELRSRRTVAAQSENEILLETLRADLARQSALNTEEHPSVKSLRRRVATLEALVETEEGAVGSPSGQAAALIASEGREIQRLRGQIAEDEEQAADLSARIDRTPTVGEELAALEQKAQVMREDYIASLRKVEEAELAETLELARQGAQVSVLNRARPPETPVRPRWLLLAGGAVASLGLALGVAVLLELLDPVVVSIRQLEEIAEQPALGSVPWVS